ncbi:MAG: acyl-CoA synthetase [Gammaproteobacteria bacterium]|nr:acyl-CoA synthetase [Gammaproteobacteria bacterium]
MNSLSTLLSAPELAARRVCADTGRRGGELRAGVQALAAHLRGLPGERVLLACQSSYSFALGLFALWQAGKIAVLPPNAQAGSLEALGPEVAGVLSDEPARPGFGFWLHPETAPATQANPADLPPLPADAALELWTSGSSGSPKRIAKTLAQLDAELAALEVLFGAGLSGCTVLSGVPHGHIYGLLFRVLWPLCAGRPFLEQTSLQPEALVRDLARHAPAILVSSPAQLKRLPECLDLHELAGLTQIFSSGGPLAAETARAWQEALGLAPVEVLGSTETGGVAWRRQSAGPAWTPMPGVLADGDEQGALRVRSVQAGTEALVMGDAVEFLADGRFALGGRLDRIVKVEEKRLSLPDMEARLTALPEVAEAAVTVLKTRRSEVAAVIVLRPEAQAALLAAGKPALNARLRAGLAAHFEAVLLPRRWRYVEALPYNERGKLPTAVLSQLFEAQDMSAAQRRERRND